MLVLFYLDAEGVKEMQSLNRFFEKAIYYILFIPGQTLNRMFYRKFKQNIPLKYTWTKLN